MEGQGCHHEVTAAGRRFWNYGRENAGGWIPSSVAPSLKNDVAQAGTINRTGYGKITWVAGPIFYGQGAAQDAEDVQIQRR